MTLRPVDAASLIIVDTRSSEPKILMGRRHENHSFMPGIMVFPGGKVERSDRKSTGDLSPLCHHRLQQYVSRPSFARSRALAQAALRETHEETGYEIAEISALTFIARAITPPDRAKRFDTRFFLTDYTSIAHHHPSQNDELVEIGWLTFHEARKEKLHIITQYILEETEKRLQTPQNLKVPLLRVTRGHFERISL